MSLSHRRGKDWVHPSKAESLILSGPINPLQRAARVKIGHHAPTRPNFREVRSSSAPSCSSAYFKKRHEGRSESGC